MRQSLLSAVTGLAVLLPAAVAFAQKAPPGDIGVSAPEPGLLLMGLAACLPLLLHRLRKS